MTSPTQSQLAYIESLARAAKSPVPHVETMDDASKAIDDLLGKVPLRADTRMAIFASLRDTRFTKDDLYQAVGVSSLSDGSGATERDGQRALKWLKGEAVEVRRAASGHFDGRPGVRPAASSVAATTTNRPSGRPGMRPASSPALAPVSAPKPATRAGMRPGSTGRGSPATTPDGDARRRDLEARGLVRELRPGECPVAIVDGSGGDLFDEEALTPFEKQRFWEWCREYAKSKKFPRFEHVKWADWRAGRVG